MASASGRPVGGPITTLEPDLKLADVEVADYVGLIIPCMAVGTWTAAIAPEAVAIVKQAVAEGKPVAAQRGGVVIVAQAGVLAGRRYAFLLAGRDPRGDPRFADAIYSGTGVVQDGNIITSAVCSERAKRHGLPDGTAELTQALIAELAFLSVVEPGNKLATTWAKIKFR